MAEAANSVTGDYIQMDQVDWVPFPEGLCKGDIKWKLLHVSPEQGAWTAIFDCKAGSSFAKHIHMGPGEYFLTKGRMHVRGGTTEGGATAVAPDFSWNANADYRRALRPGLDVVAGLQISHNGSYEGLLAWNPVTNPDYTLVNAQVGVAAERWELMFNVENLADEEYTWTCSTSRTSTSWTRWIPSSSARWGSPGSSPRA